MPADTPATSHRIERVLAVVAATLIVLGAIAIGAILIARTASVDVSQGAWPSVLLAPIPALGLGFLSIVAYMIVSARRRLREQRDAGR